jgi:regulator of replication initiation timing
MPDRVMEVVTALGGAGVGAGVVGGFWAWLRGRPAGQAALISAAAQLQAAVTEAAKAQVESLRTEIEGLHARIGELERENEQCREEGAALRGELRQQRQTIESLVRQLRDPAATLPGGPLEGALIQLTHDEATVIQPPRPRRRRK